MANRGISFVVKNVWMAGVDVLGTLAVQGGERIVARVALLL